jgi:hypothetical protein
MPVVRAGLLLMLLPALAAAAPVIQDPEGGRAVMAVDTGVICAPVQGGWTLGADGRSIRPPAKADEGSRTQVLRVAASAALCDASQDTVTVIATGPFPRIDAAATVFFPDDGRLELQGTGLELVGITWSGPPRAEPHPAPWWDRTCARRRPRTARPWAAPSRWRGACPPTPSSTGFRHTAGEAPRWPPTTPPATSCPPRPSACAPAASSSPSRSSCPAASTCPRAPAPWTSATPRRLPPPTARAPSPSATSPAWTPA